MNCPLCQNELKIIKAGVSKTSGKSYPAFYVCPNKCNLKGAMDTRVESDRFNPPPGTFNLNPSPKPNEGMQILTEHILALKDKVDEMIRLIKEQISI